jgi:uncharacterized membrane protein
MPKPHFIERLASILVVSATGIALLAGEMPLALGLAVGGILAVVNFYLLRALMGAIIASEHPPRQAALTVLLVFKFALMGTAIYLVLRYLPLDPKGLLLGVSVVVASILIAGFRAAMREGNIQAQESSSDG